MSAKLKLTIWVTVQMLAFTLLAIVFFYLVYGKALTDNPKSRLVKITESNARKIKYKNGEYNLKGLNPYKFDVYSVVCDYDGNILHGASPENFPSDFSFEKNIVRTAKYNETEYFVYDLSAGAETNGFIVRGIIDAGSKSGYVSTFVLSIVVLIPMAIVISLGGGWLMSWKAFRPMEEIIDTADSISESDDRSRRIGLKRGSKEMRRLSGTFDKMFERLFKSSVSEKQFASDASHELRTPITVITAECDRAHRKNKTVEDYEKTIGVIEEQSRNMSELIDQLLILTRIEQGTDKYPLETINLSELTESYCEEFVPKDTRGIKFSANIEKDIFVRCNTALISSVVGNYLTNAYKYGSENGNVRLGLSCEGHNAVLSVEDDGDGIASEDIENIWKRFWQADASRGVRSGSGLGLSLVKEIAEFHKGRVGVETKEGKGSRFLFILPLVQK